LKALTNVGSRVPSVAADCAASSGRAPKFHPADSASRAAQTKNVRILDKPIMTRSLLEKK